MEDSDAPMNNQPLAMEIHGNIPSLVSRRRLEGSRAGFRGGAMVPWGVTNCESFHPKKMEVMKFPRGKPWTALVRRHGDVV